jgi:hypothetical protein
MPELIVVLDAFMQEHRRCGELDSRTDDGLVWIACECGAQLVRPDETRRASDQTGD